MRIAVSLVPLSLLTAALAAQTPGWNFQPTPTSPAARQDHAMARDVGGSEVVLFGGSDAAGWLGDTWLWRGTAWSRATLPMAPSGRHRHAMASDPSRGRAVLFGGSGPAGLLGDTWEWDGSAWSALAAAAAPAPRDRHAMAFDTARGVVVLFGGRNGQVFGDTWEWDGVNWTQRSPAASPPPRFDHAMAWDGLRQKVVLFGGLPGPTADTWEWDGTSWTQVSAGAAPSPRHGHAMAFEGAAQTVVMFGGESGGFLGDTWEWNGSVWTRAGSLLAPPARSRHAMASDGAGLPVLFGGYDGQPRADTWRFASPSPAAYDLFGIGCGRSPAPALGSSLLPRVGQPFELLLTNLPPFRVGVMLTGGSNRQYAGFTLPLALGPYGMPGCTLLVSGELQSLLVVAGGTATAWRFTIPNNAFLLGRQFYNQAFFVDPPANPTGVIATNAGRATIGLPAPNTITETFSNNLMLDLARSSGSWGAGTALPGMVGFDGLHGDFDPTIGRQIAPQVFEWDTDSTLIPRAYTLSGQDELVTDGVFRFAVFTLPQGVTVRFIGSKPARIFVRGHCQVDGRLDLTAASVPRANAQQHIGQLGGIGGAGAGAGGNGADAGSGTGNQPRFNGQDGDDVRLAAGHAYLARAVGTGGRGSPQYPADGLNSSVTFRGLSNLFSAQIVAGGGGGGFGAAGQIGQALFSLSNELGPPAAGGVLLDLMPVPPTASHLDHFTAGGAGGGGSGSHPFFTTKANIEWRSGGAGAGAGGGVALRAGRRFGMGTAGEILAVGGDTSDVANVIGAAPGGGGSGGSILLQAPALGAMAGVLDVTGGTAGRWDDPGVFQVKTVGGDGGHGVIRLETSGSPGLAALGTTRPPTSAGNTALSAGTLTDADKVTGQQSNWYQSGLTTPPTWLRYEIDATVNGAPIRFSDDPAVGVLAGSGQAVQFLVQGALLNSAGQVDPATITPWRTHVGSNSMAPALNDDAVTVVRFVLLFDAAVATSIAVDQVRIVWQ